MEHAATIARHERIALQFSGGKDSLAVLFLMRPFWDRLTVYHVNSGDAFPEVRRTIDHVKALVPRFVEVQGRQPEVQVAHGWPADMVPAASNAFGQFMGDSAPRLIDRYTCCFQSLNLPMHERMCEDRITLIIRGQKNADAQKPPLRSGDTEGGFEFLYPVEDWSDPQLFAYLAQQEIPAPAYYAKGLTSSPDCLHCTAWLERGGPRYLMRYHPEVGKQVLARLRLIDAATAPLARQLAATVHNLNDLEKYREVTP